MSQPISNTTASGSPSDAQQAPVPATTGTLKARSYTKLKKTNGELVFNNFSTILEEDKDIAHHLFTLNESVKEAVTSMR